MKPSHILFVIAFIAVAATNIILAVKVDRLAYDIERLNRAYIDAITSFRGVSDAMNSLPPPLAGGVFILED